MHQVMVLFIEVRVKYNYDIRTEIYQFLLGMFTILGRNEDNRVVCIFITIAINPFYFHLDIYDVRLIVLFLFIQLLLILFQLVDSNLLIPHQHFF